MNEGIEAALAKHPAVPVCDDCWDDDYADVSVRGDTNNGTTCMACRRAIPQDQKHWLVRRGD